MSAVLQEQPSIQTAPADMSVVLHMTDDIRGQLMQGERALHVAEAFEIDSPEMAQAASDERASMASKIDRIKVLRKGFLAPAQQIMDNANALFNPAIQSLEAGRKLLGDRLLSWQLKEKQRIELENAEREARERKERQEAEARAAAEAARAAEIARKAEREAQEAEERRKAAEAEGNTRAAAAAAAEAARAQEKAAAAIENGEAKASMAHMAVPAVTTKPAAAPAKIAGSTMRENWVAVLDKGVTEDDAKLLIVKAAVDNPMLLGLLKVDTSAINKMAKALKGQMRVPGYTAVDQPILAGSRKK